MKLIALTGGIASGKSTVARMLADHGAVHIDADQLAREAVEPGSAGLQQIFAHFGDRVQASDGSLDRPALSAIVFHDARALAALNRIVHPEVRRLYDERVARAHAADPDAIIIYDVPLLVESQDQREWDHIVVTEAPADVRLDRMVRLRGMTRTDAQQRIAHQADDDARRAIADVIIDTGGTKTETQQQVDALWQRVAGHAQSGGYIRPNSANQSS